MNQTCLLCKKEFNTCSCKFKSYPLRVLFIDAENKRVSLLSIDKENAYDEMANKLGANVLDAVALYAQRDYIYFDVDKKHNPNNRYFTFLGKKFYGNAIIAGVNHWGECLSHRTEMREVREEIRF